MSIKTLRKRIALVAVSALGVGLLSVVPASAATPTITVSNANTLGVVTAAAGSLNGQTLTITSAGQVGVTLAAGTASSGIFTVSGGTITSISALQSGVTGASASGTYLLTGSSTPTIVVKPNAGATQMVLKTFDTTADHASGTSYDKLTVSIVAATTVGKLSSAYSFARLNTTNGGSASTYTDVDGANYRSVTQEGYIDFSVRDENNNVMPSSTVITATATNGALVAFASASQLGSSASTTTGASGNGTIFIATPTDYAPITTTVTISINGTAWISKSLTITGQLASIKAVEYTIGRYASSGTTTGSVLLYSYDSAGNQLATSVVPVGSYYDSVVSAADTVTTSKTTYAAGTFTCINRGSANLQWYASNTVGTVIRSNVLPVRCAGDPYTFTASLDKASYKPGDVATLTITAKDSKGNLTNGTATLGTTESSGKTTYAVSLTGGQLTVVTAPTTADTFTDADGSKKYKFTVGTTEGDYNMVVDLPKWQGSAQSAVTIPYKVSTGVTSVTNAEVLAAIVKLIASINKQIAALQKQLRKR
jgi:hypothetical protein